MYTFALAEQSHSYLLLSDPEVKFINLTSQHNDQYYPADKDGKVKWVVNIDGYPKPEVRWYELLRRTGELNEQYSVL